MAEWGETMEGNKKHQDGIENKKEWMKRKLEVKKLKIHILLFDDFETLDIFGPVEILARVEENELVYESLSGGIVRSAQGTHIVTARLGKADPDSVLVIPGVIFSESMLSYLGIVKLGGATTTSLGTLLSDASSIWTSYPSLMIFPALVISLLMICFNLFGNGLRDAFNPQLRGSDE